MEQEKVTINGIAFRQPDEGMKYDFETTYSQDSGRTIDGVMHETPMFTVEKFSYNVTGLNAAETSQLFQNIIGKRFTLHYFSPYYGEWRTAPFQVGKGSLSIKRVIKDNEYYNNISFNMIGVNPI